MFGIFVLFLFRVNSQLHNLKCGTIRIVPVEDIIVAHSELLLFRNACFIGNSFTFIDSNDSRLRIALQASPTGHIVNGMERRDGNKDVERIVNPNHIIFYQIAWNDLERGALGAE